MNLVVKEYIERVPAKRRRWVIGAVVVIGIFLAWRLGLVGWLVALRAPKPDDSVPVVVAEATANDVPLYLEGIGTVRAYNTVTVHSRVDGQLLEVTFQEGQNIKKGDVLARIDPRPFQAMVDSANGNLARDQSSLANAQRDLERYQELVKNGFAPQQRVDTQRATANSLAASVRSDEGALRNAKVQLGYATIISPIDGRTGIRQIDAGNIIHAADPNGLVVITQLQPISAIFTMPQKDLARVVAAGDPAGLKTTAFSSDGTTELDQGVLELIDNTIDPATGTVRLKARFPNAHGSLWPGEFINVRLQLAVAKAGVTVPSEAVQRGPKGPYAYVVKPDNTAEVRLLRLGQESSGRTLITGGLNASERVVTDGVLRLVPGTKVRATAASGGAGTADAAASSDGSAAK